jgi:hypothetical protein
MSSIDLFLDVTVTSVVPINGNAVQLEVELLHKELQYSPLRLFFFDDDGPYPSRALWPMPSIDLFLDKTLMVALN